MGWGEVKINYLEVEQFLVQYGIESDDIVMVRDAPAYYLETNRSAVSIPYGGIDAILAVSEQFDAYYLILEPEAAIESLKTLIENPNQNSQFIFLGTIDESNIFKIIP